MTYVKYLKDEVDFIYLSQIDEWYVLSQQEMIDYLIDNRIYILINDFHPHLIPFRVEDLFDRFDEIEETRKKLIEE